MVMSFCQQVVVLPQRQGSTGVTGKIKGNINTANEECRINFKGGKKDCLAVFLCSVVAFLEFTSRIR